MGKEPTRIVAYCRVSSAAEKCQIMVTPFDYQIRDINKYRENTEFLHSIKLFLGLIVAAIILLILASIFLKWAGFDDPKLALVSSISSIPENNGDLYINVLDSNDPTLQKILKATKLIKH